MYALIFSKRFVLCSCRICWQRKAGRLLGRMGRHSITLTGLEELRRRSALILVFTSMETSSTIVSSRIDNRMILNCFRFFSRASAHREHSAFDLGVRIRFPSSRICFEDLPKKANKSENSENITVRHVFFALLICFVTYLAYRSCFLVSVADVNSPKRNIFTAFVLPNC